MFPSLGDIFKPIGNLVSGVKKDIGTVFKDIKSFGEGAIKTAVQTVKGVGEIFKDPLSSIKKSNEIAKEIARGAGGVINAVVGKGGISTAVGSLVEETIGRGGKAVVETADGIGRNPLVAGSLLAGSGGFLGIGIAAAAIALMVALK